MHTGPEYPSIFCVCPKLGPGFRTPYVVVYIMFNNLRREMIVRFVDIGGMSKLTFHN